MRGAAASVLGRPVVARALQRFEDGTVPIFLLHRVRSTPLDDHLPLTAVEAALEAMRRRGYRFVSLAEVVAAACGRSRLPAGAVAFTADDGYVDQADVLAPVFERYECPLTIFLVSGFLDRTFVPWWDRIEHAVATTERGRLDVEFAGRPFSLPLGGRAERVDAMYALISRYRVTPAAEAEAAVDGLFAQLDLDAPAVPFGPYQPMDWEQARALERRGVISFGPHTVCHPILSRAGLSQVEAEIDGSRARLAEELERPLSVFCYPVGEDGDFGPREMELVAERGFDAAVTVGRRHARVAAAATQPARRFHLDRIPLKADMDSTTFTLAGLNRIRQWLASARR